MTTNASAGAAGVAAAGAAAAIAQAIKASGAIVRVEPQDFLTLLARADEPLVVCSQTRFFSSSYHYLTSYKGLCFYTKANEPLRLPDGCETIEARSIWIPG